MRFSKCLGRIKGIGTTQPFIAECEDGRTWVLKGVRDQRTAEHVVRDFIGGSFANWLGLPWPSKVVWGEVPPTWMEEKDLVVPWCIATEYLSDLRQLDYGVAPGVWTSNDPFISMAEAERVSKVSGTLTPFLADEINLAALYGRTVFDNWLGESDPMMDMLQFRQDTHKLVCLDASTALHSRSEAKSMNASVGKACPHFAARGWTLYARATLVSSSGFHSWLKKLNSFDEATWDGVVSEIPRLLRRQCQPILDLKPHVLEIQTFTDEFTTSGPYGQLATKNA